MADPEKKARYVQRALRAGQVFRPATPVDERSLFAGRTKQLRLVIDAVSQPGQHVMIFGERGVGKTSLATVLPEFLEFFSSANEKHVFSRRVNCDTKDSFASVWTKVFRDFTLSISEPGIGFEASDRTAYVKLIEQMPKDITPNDVQQTLAMIGRTFNPIIIIDEFDRLQKHSSLFADTIKTLSDQSILATVILVGVADSVDDLIREHASIERALVQIPMPRMSIEEINEIVNNGLKRLEMTITEDALAQIGYLAQGLPHYAHLLGLHACRAALDDKAFEINRTHVDKAIANATESAQQSIRTSYTTAISSPRRESLFREVLLACALAPTDDLGYFSASDVRNPMSTIMNKHYDIPSFARHLKEFSEPIRGGILSKAGPQRRIRYRFVNPLMQPYVIMRGVSDELINQDQLKRLRSA